MSLCCVLMQNDMLSVLMLSVLKLSVLRLSVLVQNVLVPSVLMLSILMLSDNGRQNSSLVAKFCSHCVD